MTISRASPSQVGGTIADATSPNTYALPNNVSVGQLVVVGCFSDGAGVFASGDCTKSAGTATIGSFVLDKTVNQTTDQHAGIWSAIVTGAGSLTVAVATGGSFSVIGVNVYDGTWDSSRLESSNSAVGTTSTTPSSGNATSAGAALFFGVLAVGNSALVTLTEDSNWTSVKESNDGGSHEVGEVIDRIVSSGTTDDANWTISVAPTRTATCVAVYKEVGGGGGSVTSRSVLRQFGAYGAYQLFRRETRSYSILTDRTVALTGQSITSAQGTLTPALDKALAGSSITSAQGTLTPASSIALSGLAITSAQGTLTAALSKALTGSVITSASGTLVPGTSISLSGQAATFALGTLTANLTKALTGQSATYAQGTLIPSLSIALTGQSATFGQGTITTGSDVAVSLSGQAFTSAAGSLVPSLSKALSGIALTSSQGTLTPSLSKVLSGQAITSAQGTVSVSVDSSITLALTGQSVTLAPGTLGFSVSIPLSGNLLTATQGHFGIGTETPTSSELITVHGPGNYTVTVHG
jgi:hypothetical protein